MLWRVIKEYRKIRIVIWTDTCLDVELLDGRVEKYVVNVPNDWADRITEACSRVGNYIHVG